MIKLKSSNNYHFLVALAIAIWLSVFLILIAPFDIAELPIAARLEIMPFYGLISFIGYVILIPFQNWAYKKIQKQSIYFEILIIVLFNILVLIGSYIYYKSSIVNGDYSFIKFTLEIYYPIFFILLPIIIFARWFISRKIAPHNSKKLVLTGDNKLDILQIKEEDLICISSADNYVTVTYLVNDVLSKKLLRTTLKNIESQLPELMKVHRSHLINPIHFKEWKNANTLLLTHIEVPVSKNYKKAILAMNHSPLKTNSSPLS
ncbi:LytTR family DNA-binding domain-containing protein [uncultured Aquimarina sp.]|uniref:LytTR family DNA-binding domain-containing protein n=1 Tax=uncultured Aquimarina sp. TaxID=575652 RepID=UPI0026218553|nr:LytTR family DNA-binding domain-containing protein [uncultured Aquimarina sp.]